MKLRLQGATNRSNNQPIMRTRSGSGDHMHKRGHTSEGGGIRRSNSDSNLLLKKSASPLVDDEFSKALPPFEEYKDSVKKIYHKHRSKSLDFYLTELNLHAFLNPPNVAVDLRLLHLLVVLENTSIKDSPMQIDAVVSSTDNSCNNSEIGTTNSLEARSVMSGGTTRGWMPDVAVVLWKRMLGTLGNINKIKDASVHAQVLKYLIITQLLLPPELVPPLLLVTPWLFEALNLSDKYKKGNF
ncbi:hypothetical protein CEXT_291441 [Caerostris extrusa]|uniref:Uncharacterized protein n=1 Tax=Caerostris extrusa TaxID=172846 RepID=A0AAV4S555_CAEEX|nr:hypothetical protein CEXT_291441 [Caerostris extrusa]